MPFCPKCGTEYQDGSKFCAKCGANLDGSVAPVPINQKPGFFQEILDTRDVTSTMDANDINAGKAMSILAYCAVLAYILVTWLLGDFFAVIVLAGLLVAPCIAAKKSGFYNLISNPVYDYISNYVGMVRTETVIGTIVAWVIHIIFMAIPVLVLVAGLINSANGKAKELPLIGRFKMIFEK
ncbi:MAG: zinc ribbon domain-containing protein [[Eubacterium] siraeum]|nr:zinc ribbon domain-containing protein [[Eubacterium] siraeum]